MTPGAPEKVRAWPVAGSVDEEAGDSGRAMWTEVRRRGVAPKAFERWTRRAGPAAERWKISRMVESRRDSGGRAFWGSGICWEAPQVAIQTDGAGAAETGAASARRRTAVGRILIKSLDTT